MKITQKSLCWYFLLFCTLFACVQTGKMKEEEVLVVDVSREYPVKKMLLQDIAKVEYIPLETSEDFLWQGGVSSFTDRYIVNRQLQGNILLFDNKGKTMKVINRMGQGGEEYSKYSAFLLDEDKNELFMNDSNKKKIFVYDLDGHFKRTLNYVSDKRYSNLNIFDDNRLIAYNERIADEEVNSFLIVSKQTGEIEQEFYLPQTERKLSGLHIIRTGENVTDITQVYVIATYPMIANYPNFIISDISNDTIYSINKSMEFTPVIIQHPSRPTMDPIRTLYRAEIESRDYLFLQVGEKKFDLTAKGKAYKSWDLVYDKKEGKIYEQDIRNGDYTTKKKINITPSFTQFSANNSNVLVEVLNAADLVEAYENNQLTGRLKEIAKELDEEDNPVLLVARFEN